MREAEVAVAALTGSGGVGSSVVFVFRDVTDRLTRERDLARERDRLSDFGDMLAHEIRNPLNVAQGHLDLVAPNTDEEAAAIDRVETGHERMEQMIRELLAHARGELVGAVQPVELERAARVAWKQIPTEDATLELSADDATVEADPERFQSVLENLFRNACEHAGPRVTVRLGLLDDGGFYVEDDGPGVPSSDRERLFDRGFTTDSAGLGLGLAFVEEVADAHEWDIEMTDSDSGGVRVEFTTSPGCQ